MECETFAAIPNDFKCTILGNTIEHKDIIADFNNIFESGGEPGFYNQYVAERCLSRVLTGRNSAHLIMDAPVNLFTNFCGDMIRTILEECSKCKIRGYALSTSSHPFCLFSKSPTEFHRSVKPIPFTKLDTIEVKSSAEFERSVKPKIADNIPISCDVVCMTISLEVIPSGHGDPTSISKLFPEMAVLLINTDNIHTSKIITDLSNLTDHITGKAVSTVISANTVGFYLSGSFACSATFHLKGGFYKQQLLLAKALRRIKTYPMINDVYGMAFLKKVTDRKEDSSAVDENVLNTLRSDLQTMAQDNIRMMEENKKLHETIDKMDIDLKNILGSKDILSEELREKLSTEQDIFNKLSEISLEKVRIQDMSETKRYELMNKIFSLENDLMTVSATANEWEERCRQLDGEKAEMEAAQSDLRTEYSTLKRNHHRIAGLQETLERKCEQLSAELVQLHLENEELMKSGALVPYSPNANHHPHRPSLLPNIPTSRRSLSAGESQAGEVSRRPVYVQEVELLRAEVEALREERGGTVSGPGVPSRAMVVPHKKDIIQRTVHLEGQNEALTSEVRQLRTTLEVARQTRECSIEEAERLKVALDALSLSYVELQRDHNATLRKYQNAVVAYRDRLNSYILDTEKILSRKHPVPGLKEKIVSMVTDIKNTYVEKERELHEEYVTVKKDYTDLLAKYHKLSEEDKNLSNRRVIQEELTKLRGEIKRRNNDIETGELLPFKKVKELMMKRHFKYQENIQKLQGRLLATEAELNRANSHLNRGRYR